MQIQSYISVHFARQSNFLNVYRVFLRIRFSYSVPVCFLPDIDSGFEVNLDFLSKVDKFVKSVTSKNLLIIADQVEINRNVFENSCNGIDVNIIFADSESRCISDTKLFGFYFTLDRDAYIDTALIYIGPHEKLSTDLGCIFYNQESLRINSVTSSCFEGSISRELTKKYGLIDSIRCCDHVGIVVENPNVRLHVETAQYLQNICSANDMIADIIYVGRLNEMKLGNFADIQFFIHLSCAGRPSFSFVKPVVTPLEFICAKFEVDFWEYQNLRDYERFLRYCASHKEIVLPNTQQDNNLGGQLVLKSFFELSSQLVGVRRNYSYGGLEINSINQEMKIHKGAVGNSTGYDYESKK